MLLVEGVFFNVATGLFGVLGEINFAEFGLVAFGTSVQINGILGLFSLTEFSVLVNGALGLDILDESVIEILGVLLS